MNKHILWFLGLVGLCATLLFTHAPVLAGKLEQQLHAAVKKGDINAVRRAVRAGADLEGDDPGETPLMVASQLNHTRIAKFLIEQGADIYASSEGYMSSHSTVHNDNVELLKAFLDAGLDVNDYEPSMGQTLLMDAAWQGKTEIVKLLLAYGADVNVTDVFGDTALAGAFAYKHQQIVKLLIAHGAKMDVRTAIFEAIYNGNIKRVKMFLDSGMYIETTDLKDGDTLLIAAVWKGKTDIVKLLLARGADIHAKNHYKQTPLAVAIKHKHKQIAQILKQAGAR